MNDDRRLPLGGWLATGEERARAISEPELGSGVWWRETAQRIVLLTVGVLVLEALVGDGRLGQGHGEPHPYWLLVLPMSASRGLVAGLIAASVATGLMLAGAALEGPLRLDRETLAVPLRFFAAAVLVGELRDLLRDRVRELVRRNQVLHDELERSEYERDLLRSSVRELERRLARGPRDLRAVIDASQRIDSGTVEDLYASALELGQEHVGDAMSVFEVSDSGARLLCCVGHAQRTEVGFAELPLVRQVLDSGRPATSFDEAFDEVHGGPRMVAPIVGPGRDVVALLCLDDLAPERLAPSTLGMLASIADWTSHGLSRLSMGRAPLPREDAAQPAVVEAPLEVPLQPLGALRRRLDREFVRSARHGLPLAVIGLQFTHDREVDVSELEAAGRQVAEQIGGALRLSDGLYSFGIPGCYALLLVGASTHGVQVLSRRLEDVVALLEEDLGGHAHVFVTGSDHGHESAEELLAALAGTFRREARRPVRLPEPVASGAPSLGDREEGEVVLRAERSLARRYGLAYRVAGVRLRARLDAPSVAGRTAGVLDQVLGRGAAGFVLDSERMLLVVPDVELEGRAEVAQEVGLALRTAGLHPEEVHWLEDGEGLTVDELQRRWEELPA